MNTLEKAIQDYVKNLVKESHKDYKKVIKKVNDSMYKEAIKIYESYIDEFYKYETTSYRRHGSGGRLAPGVPYGINLYRGLTIQKSSGNQNPFLHIRYSGDDMEGYEYDKPDDVLDYVLNGIRFPYWNYMEWSYHYDSYDFHTGGTLQEAINDFNNNFYNIAYKKFYREWHKLGWF